MVLGAVVTPTFVPAGGRAESCVQDESISHNEDLEPPHYIDSEDSESPEGDLPGPPSPEMTPPPPLKTIAFDWSTLSFGDLQFNSTVRLPEVEEECTRDHYDNRRSGLFSDTYYEDPNGLPAIIIHTEEVHKDKAKHPKALFKNCKRKLIMSGKNLRDRSRSVEVFHNSGKLNTIFRTHSSESRPNESETWSSSPLDTNLRSARVSGKSSSMSSLRPAAKLRSRIRDTVWVTGVRRRESIGLITQPMMSALRGAGRKVKHRARSVSKSRGSLSAGSDDSHSAAHSSDCEDGEKSDSASLMDRFRGLRKDMQKKISKVKSPRGAPYGTNDDGQLGMRAPDARPRPPHGPVDAAADRVVLRKRLNSGGPLSTSPPPPAPYTGPFIGRAVALTDFQPSPYDVDLLKFNKGDVIDIISKSPSGQWRGCVDGRVGEFKFILVEEETERDRLHRKLRGQRSSPLEQFPHASVEALFRHFKLSHLLQIFILHGYETLDQFREVDEQDLDNLGIRDPETREKLLAAVASILEYEQNSIVGHVSEASVANNTSSSSRDSGCFTDQKAVSNCLVPDSEGSHTDGRQSSPSTDNSSGYQGRGNYIMSHAGEVSSTLQEVPDTTLDSSSSTEEDVTSKESNQLVIASHSQQRDLNMRSSDKGEPDSYRATPALVMPGTPEDSPQLRRKLDDDNVIASARCSSDTGVSVQSSSSEAVVPSHHGDG